MNRPKARTKAENPAKGHGHEQLYRLRTLSSPPTVPTGVLPCLRLDRAASRDQRFRRPCGVRARSLRCELFRPRIAPPAQRQGLNVPARPLCAHLRRRVAAFARRARRSGSYQTPSMDPRAQLRKPVQTTITQGATTTKLTTSRLFAISRHPVCRGDVGAESSPVSIVRAAPRPTALQTVPPFCAHERLFGSIRAVCHEGKARHWRQPRLPARRPSMAGERRAVRRTPVAAAMFRATDAASPRSGTHTRPAG